MFDFLDKPYPFNTDLKYSLKLGSGIAIGVFLFILFFQPLELDKTDLDGYILTIAGFAGISFFLISLLKIILPWAFKGLFRIERWDLKREIFLLLLIWILNSVAFSFYLAYVGRVSMSMYLAFKIVLMCFVLTVLILLSNEMNYLKVRVLEIWQKNRDLEKRLGNNLHEKKAVLELLSDNRTEKLVLEPHELILVKSAENYVEIIYRENQTIQKKLLRSTMRSIEDQLRSNPDIVRCHRTCIVNIGSGIKMHRTVQGIKLRIHGYDEEIPVSRQYLIGVRAAFEKHA